MKTTRGLPYEQLIQRISYFDFQSLNIKGKEYRYDPSRRQWEWAEADIDERVRNILGESPYCILCLHEDSESGSGEPGVYVGDEGLLPYGPASFIAAPSETGRLYASRDRIGELRGAKQAFGRISVRRDRTKRIYVIRK